MNEKMQAYWAKHEQWLKERDEAALSFDLKKFKTFYLKWQAEGLYSLPLPADDYVIEIAMRQMVLGLKDPPKDKADEARQWLKDHNCSADPWRR